MIKNQVIPTSSQVAIVTLFIVFFAVLFSLANTIYSNYQYDQKIKQFEVENKRLEQQNKLKLYEYLRTGLRLVLEKEKKETMNQINPGEQVIVLHNDDRNKELFTPPPSTSNPREEQAELYKDKSNPEKWYHYFFDT